MLNLKYKLIHDTMKDFKEWSLFYMGYSAKSQKKYNDKCRRYGIKYMPNEYEEVNRLENYLKDTKQSINGYIKTLIKNDLDSKGI